MAFIDCYLKSVIFCQLRGSAHKITSSSFTNTELVCWPNNATCSHIKSKKSPPHTQNKTGANNSIYSLYTWFVPPSLFQRTICTINALICVIADEECGVLSINALPHSPSLTSLSIYCYCWQLSWSFCIDFSPREKIRWRIEMDSISII